MKGFSASALVVVLGLASATGHAAANSPERGSASPGSMSGMMHGSAGEMMHGMPMNAGGRMLGRERPVLSLALRHRGELGLSDDQATTLQGFVDRFGKEAKEQLRELETAERELAGLLQEETADLAQVGNKVRAIEKLRADLRLRRIQTIAEGQAVLTSEQRAKLDRVAAEGGRSGQGQGTRGAEEMHRFMNSERMPQAMDAMMAMAERMGGGDTMLGMVRMMEMMSMMGGGMMGGEEMGKPRRSEPPRQEENK